MPVTLSYSRKSTCAVCLLETKLHLLSGSTAGMHSGTAMASLPTVASGLHLCTPAIILKAVHRMLTSHLSVVPLRVVCPLTRLQLPSRLFLNCIVHSYKGLLMRFPRHFLQALMSSYCVAESLCWLLSISIKLLSVEVATNSFLPSGHFSSAQTSNDDKPTTSTTTMKTNKALI